MAPPLVERRRGFERPTSSPRSVGAGVPPAPRPQRCHPRCSLFLPRRCRGDAVATSLIMMWRVRRAGRLGPLHLRDLTIAFASVKRADTRAAAVGLTEDGLA
eukprot:6711839-Pyramimonas_sp.AAC.1